MPSLADLPYELRQVVLVHVACHSTDRRALPALATVCSEWQAAIEAFTFARIHLNPARLQTFASIATGRRRARVRTISLHVPLDPYPTRLNDDKESSQARKHTAATLIAPLESLFTILHDWPTSTSPHKLCLFLTVDSVSDIARDDKWGHAGLTNRARSSPLLLDRMPMNLPTNNVVHSIRCNGRHLQPISLLSIGSRCLRLDSLDVELNHDSSSDRDEKQRATFAGNLDQQASGLRHLTLRRPRARPGSNAAPRRQPWSAFYSGLRRFSQQCETLAFDDCVDALEFFAPFLRETAASDQDIPHWTRLRTLQVRNSYMLRRPYLRVKHQSQALTVVHKLILAVGQSVKHMPALEKARISLCILSNVGLEWITLTYVFANGCAALDVKGITPSKAATDAWGRSVVIAKGSMLDISIDPRDAGLA